MWICYFKICFTDQCNRSDILLTLSLLGDMSNTDARESPIFCWFWRLCPSLVFVTSKIKWRHHYMLLLFILTTNRFLPGGSDTTVRHNTQITPHITQNNTPRSNKTQHTNYEALSSNLNREYTYMWLSVLTAPYQVWWEMNSSRQATPILLWY
jgi:hypothetical protein